MSDFKPKITLTQAMTSPNLFGRVFAAPSFWTWRVLAKLIDGIELVEPREIELYQQCTGRTQLPHQHDQQLLKRYACSAAAVQEKIDFSAPSLFGVLRCAQTGAIIRVLVSRSSSFCLAKTESKLRFCGAIVTAFWRSQRCSARSCV